MRRPRPLPRELAHAPFHVADTGELPEGRLRRSDLVAPFRGMRIPRAIPFTVEMRARAALVAVGPRAIVSHASAAELWGLPLPPGGARKVDIAVVAPARATRITGIRGHRLTLAPWDVIRRADGIILTSPERSWCDLASVLSPEDLLAAGDRLLWRHDPLSSRQRLAAAVAAHPLRKSTAKLRLVLPELSERADSRPESLLRWRILQAGLPRPAANHAVRDSGGRVLASVDLAFPAQRMAIETRATTTAATPSSGDATSGASGSSRTPAGT